MDEPLGALDKKLREHMQIELKKLRPERIDILTEAHKERKNVFPAIIQEDLYIGNFNRYLVEVPSWRILVNVELRNAQDTVRFQTGQNVFISWRVLDTILVKE